MGDFPFYIVQLANLGAPNTGEPARSDWAELRESQSMVARSVPQSGIAVTIDIGDANDIHPKDKLDVGHRLALTALAKHYKRKIDYSGPVFKSMKIESDRIRISYYQLSGGLVVKNGSCNGFAIAGNDQRFVWANAVSDGNSIVVWSPKVANPCAVRYAWANNPVCNVYNKAGLPAEPFRTDTWPN
jgi:sialate O-acetylesterase